MGGHARVREGGGLVGGGVPAEGGAFDGGDASVEGACGGSARAAQGDPAMRGAAQGDPVVRGAAQGDRRAWVTSPAPADQRPTSTLRPPASPAGRCLTAGPLRRRRPAVRRPSADSLKAPSLPGRPPAPAPPAAAAPLASWDGQSADPPAPPLSAMACWAPRAPRSTPGPGQPADPPATPPVGGDARWPRLVGRRLPATRAPRPSRTNVLLTAHRLTAPGKPASGGEGSAGSPGSSRRTVLRRSSRAAPRPGCRTPQAGPVPHAGSPRTPPGSRRW